MQLGLLRQGDWLGIATMAIGLGALQTVLEEGNKDDWFGSPFIVRLPRRRRDLARRCSSGSSCTTAQPLLNLRLLLRRNFGFGTLAMFLLGIALYGSVFLLPLYLAQVQGYNAEQIGMVLAWTGLPQLAADPAGAAADEAVRCALADRRGLRAVRRQQLHERARSTATSRPTSCFWPNIVRAVGQALVLTPLVGARRRPASSPRMPVRPRPCST